MHWRTPGPLSDLWLRALLLRRHDAPAPRPEARGRRFQRRGTFAELFSVSNYLFSMHFFGASAATGRDDEVRSPSELRNFSFWCPSDTSSLLGPFWPGPIA
jgi:hypothetical protein